MHPVLFQFEWLNQTRTVQAYGAALLVAGIVFCLSALLTSPMRGLSRWSVLACLLVVVPALLLGSRLLFWATNLKLYRPQTQHPLSLTLADFSLPGGLILAAVVVAMAGRALKWNAWAMADVLTPGTALAIAIVRVGCFLNGCCCGVASDVPWAVTYPSGSLAHLRQAAGDLTVLVLGPRPVHPTQLYELAAALVASALGIWLIRRKAPLGVPFLVAGAWYCTFRIANDLLRPISPTLSAPHWFFPVLLALLVAACAAALTLRWRASAQDAHAGARRLG